MTTAIRDQFMERVRKIKSYIEAAGLLMWDLRTGAPRAGIPQRSQTIGMLQTEAFKLTIADDMGEWLDALSQPEAWEQLTPMEQRLVEVMRRSFERSRKIPTDIFQKYVVLVSEAESVWEDAKKEANFAKFQPYLEQIVDYNRQFAELYGYEEHPYDALLDDYEQGMTVRKLDALFGQVREQLVPLVAHVKNSRQPDVSFLKQPFSKEQQRQFSLYILKEMGYDFEAGRLDETEHPFAIGLNPRDVRVTTRFKPDDLTFALFSTIHEGGHALYEQNFAEELTGTPLADGASYGIHESQSRFWEIFIAMSRPFWNRYLPELKKVFPGQLDDVTVDQFYRAINRAEPSLIRIEADELTYNLHIMIRYEIEKQLIAGQIEVKDLPQIWNDKYEEYLGVHPSHDGEGVLQDVHWAGGSFGYFPSYSLGNMYAAQICAKMKQEMPDFTAMIERGELAPIKAWLTDRIHRHGMMMRPEQFMKQVTGEDLDARYLIEHLRTKFGELYS
jgi:carboxypeptidase Taq